MKIIDLQPVKRCPKCGRLIPQHLDTCPYCEGEYTLTRPQREPDSQATRPAPAPRQPMSPKTKKRILYGIGAAAALALIAFGIVFIMSTLKLNRSILKTYTEDEITSICKDHPNFREQYAMIGPLREYINNEGIQSEYEDISYKDCIEYIEKIQDKAWNEEIQNKAKRDHEEKFRTPVLSKLKAETAKWEKYIQEHDPNKYLVITPHERNIEDDYDWYNYAGFYYTLQFPKGNIKDCSAHCGLVSRSDHEWRSNAEEWSDLAALQRANINANYRWNAYTSLLDNVYDNYTMRVELYSVTLNDGTIITIDDIEENVPKAAKAYIDDKSETNEARFIRECIDKDYPLLSEYIANAYDNALKNVNPLIFKLLERMSGKRTDDDDDHYQDYVDEVVAETAAIY